MKDSFLEIFFKFTLVAKLAEVVLFFLSLVGFTVGTTVMLSAIYFGIEPVGPIASAAFALAFVGGISSVLVRAVVFVMRQYVNEELKS